MYEGTTYAQKDSRQITIAELIRVQIKYLRVPDEIVDLVKDQQQAQQSQRGGRGGPQQRGDSRGGRGGRGADRGGRGRGRGRGG